MVETFNLFSRAELNYATQRLMEDLRNNSAWNYRYFIVGRLSNNFKEQQWVDEEVGFTLLCVEKDPANESSWSYLSG